MASGGSEDMVAVTQYLGGEERMPPVGARAGWAVAARRGGRQSTRRPNKTQVVTSRGFCSDPRRLPLAPPCQSPRRGRRNKGKAAAEHDDIPLDEISPASPVPAAAAAAPNKK